MKRVEAVSEKIALIFGAENYKGVIHTAEIYLRLGSGQKSLDLQ